MDNDNKENGFVSLRDASLLAVFMCSATSSIWGYMLIALAVVFLLFFDVSVAAVITLTVIGALGVLFSIWLKANAKYCSAIHTKKLIEKLDHENS